MRALEVVGRNVQVVELDDPAPGPGEAVVAVHSCGICGSDVHGVEHGQLNRGQVLGHEMAGTVVALGAGATGWREGDRVAVNPLGACGHCEECRRALSFRCAGVPNLGLSAPGGFAEYVAVPLGQLYALDEGTSFEAAAHTEPLAVALHGVHLAGAGAGTRAVVFGVGTIGLSVVMALRALGASEVVAIGRSAGRRKAAEAVGAEVVDSSTVDLAAYFAQRAGTFDAAFECSGAPEAFGFLLEGLASNGTFVELALTSQEAPVSLGDLLARNLHVVGSCAFGPGEFAESLALIQSGAVNTDPLVSVRVSLDEAPQTFVDLRHPKELVGALVQPWRAAAPAHAGESQPPAA
jgi:threonine dehydrogenase-like Zn-dependent dehydrogenase